jgi:carboxylesterase
MRTNPELVNPHLEGGPFLWEAGETGVLLVHGYTATAAEVRPLAKILLEHGYSVAGPLLPGHGTSPADLNRFRWEEWAAAVETCYHDLSRRCRRVVIAGESMGGLLALYLAAHRPEAAGVMTYAAALKLPSNPILPFMPLLSRFIAFRTKPVRPPTQADARWQGYPVNPLPALNQLLRLQRKVMRLLPDIHQPLLVMQGRLDLSVSPMAAELIYQKAGSRIKELHWMEKSTHCVILDQEYERAAQITLDYLNRLPQQ